MDHKEKVLNSIGHKKGKIPVDFGSTAVTGMHVSCVADLRKYYELENQPVKVCEPYQMLGTIEEDLMDLLEIDTIPLWGPNTIFGFRNENWKEFKAPWGQELLVSQHFQTSKDTNHDLLIYPGGDMDVPPSGRMPTNGFFFDTIVRQEPIDDDNLDPEDNLEEFKPISDEDLAYYKKQAKLLSDSSRAVVSGLGGTAFGDIALVPAPFLKHPKGIRDIAEWYISTATRQDYLHAVFEKQCDIALKNLEKLYQTVGDLINVLFVCGTDFGTQTSTFCSTSTYDRLYAPYYKKINNWIHQHTKWKSFKHSCGAVESFMDHFIESGFDIINPVQISAAGMDPQLLKDKYGGRIVFWGGGVDTQKTIPFKTPREVRTEVLKCAEIFSRDGGFVFNAVHNLQAKTPVENIVAMFDAIKEFNS